MITTKQKWLLSGLILFSSAVWTPQIMAMMEGDTRSQVAFVGGEGDEPSVEVESGVQRPRVSAAESTASVIRVPTSSQADGEVPSLGASDGGPVGSTALVLSLIHI